jgi:hypothetical protein
MDSSEHKVPPPLLAFLGKFFLFPVLVPLWLMRLRCSAALDFSGGRGGAGGAEAVLRRVPHHRHAYVARRADRAEGEQSAPSPRFLFFLLPFRGRRLEMISALLDQGTA